MTCSGSRRNAALEHALDGKMAGKGAAAALDAVDLEARPMPMQGMFDDGQPQAGATRLAGATRIDSVEAFGEARQVF